eukprot:7386465-Prymnesium_polylepis.1
MCKGKTKGAAALLPPEPKKTRSASRRASMAPHATVPVALRRQNSFSHHSFDGDERPRSMH